jgi:glycine amidinotransferase
MKSDAEGFGPSAFLEGGDVLVFDKRVLVGISGNASNLAGVAWLRKQLGPSYAIETVPLKESFLHLDVALCTPRPGLAVVCRSAFLDGLPCMLKDWDLIEVDEEDALGSLACNALILDHKSIIVVDAPSYVAERLEDAGQTVYRMPFDKITALGGGFRCWHHPLIRA